MRTRPGGAVDNPYQHLACFVDESAASRHALEHPRLLRDQLRARRLSIVHLVPDTVYYGVYYPPDMTPPSTTPAWLEDLGSRTAGAEVVLIDSVGAYPPARAVRWASAEGVDLIVAGSHRGVYRRLVLGGFAAHLAYHASCPVVLIPPSMAVEEDATRPHDEEASRMG